MDRRGKLFVEDVRYFEHPFCVMQSRDAVKAWVAGLMGIKPYDTERVF